MDNESCNMICEGLFLGGCDALVDGSIRDFNITHVICLAQEIIFEEMVLPGVTKYYFPMNDSEEENIRRVFDICYQIIEEALSDGNILICCLCGVSRSPTIVIAYLMKKYQITPIEAFRLVRSKRIINPNYGFVKQLVHYGEELRVQT